jgi:arylsulfatase
MKINRLIWSALASGIALATACLPASAQQQRKPNIVFIMGDDVGWFNIGAYSQGIMRGKTPNLDRLAAEGMRFTDYYAEASCTAGRANFITGELPIRTGLTTVGLPGADVGMPDQAVTLATILKAQGYATGQFGKNHLGDLNKFLPTLHGFDEFFGYLYHLDAMSDPYWHDYPQDWIAKTGPRNIVHSFATDVDDPTVMPRWGAVGKQKIEDEGPLAPFANMSDKQDWQMGQSAKYNMGTFDEVLVEKSSAFMDQAKKNGKPFFIWHNTARMHVWTTLSPKYQAMMNSNNKYGEEDAGMAQMDDAIGGLLKHIQDIGEADNTIVVFTTDNGAEVFTWPDGGMTPFKATKGTVYEGGFRVPAIIRWPGKVKPGTVENGIFSGLDWLPTFSAVAGRPNVKQELLTGVKIGERTYKNYLDGYDQTALLTGQGPSARNEIVYFGGTQFGAMRIGDFKFQFYQQPNGWLGEKPETDTPMMTDLREDPFERLMSVRGESMNNGGGTGYMNSFFAREFWRFIMMQEAVGVLAKSAIDFPPMQPGAAFGIQAIKAKVEKAIANQQGQ